MRKLLLSILISLSGVVVAQTLKDSSSVWVFKATTDSTPEINKWINFSTIFKSAAATPTDSLVSYNSNMIRTKVHPSQLPISSAQALVNSDKLSVTGNGSQLTGLTKAQVGLSSVDNTSDAGKPVSTAQAAAIALKQTISVAGQGIGGTVTQATNKTTGVTLNKVSGQITMNNAALAAAAEVAFTLTNSTIASTDVVIVNVQSVGTAGAYFVTVGAVANGSCSITLGNVSAGSLSQAVVLNFAVIKAVNN